MRKLLLMVLFVSLSVALEIPSNHLVSTQWLEKNLDNKKLILIDVRDEKSYEKGHLKGAVNYPKAMWFQGKVGDVPKLYNTPQQFEEIFQNAGVIANESLVVFYSAGADNQDFADAASAMYVAWLYGFENSAILNGGFAKWSEEQKDITKEVAKKEKSDFEVESFYTYELASLDDIINAQYDDDVQIADARVAKFYTGEEGREDLARKGRIPTAKLTPMIRYVKKVGNHFEFLSKEEASKTLNNNDFGLDLKEDTIFYCNSGHKARGLWFVSKFIVGMDNVKVYDASMLEYTRTLLPMKQGEADDF